MGRRRAAPGCTKAAAPGGGRTEQAAPHAPVLLLPAFLECKPQVNCSCSMLNEPKRAKLAYPHSLGSRCCTQRQAERCRDAPSPGHHAACACRLRGRLDARYGWGPGPQLQQHSRRRQQLPTSHGRRQRRPMGLWAPGALRDAARALRSHLQALARAAKRAPSKLRPATDCSCCSGPARRRSEARNRLVGCKLAGMWRRLGPHAAHETDTTTSERPCRACTP